VAAHPPTLADVAALAGVSAATASRALGNRGDLSQTTRDRVRSVAREIGYERRPSAGGRTATVRDTRLIELVMAGFDDEWSQAIMSGVHPAATRLGYDVVLTSERQDPDDDWPARAIARRSSGVILGLIHPTAAQWQQISDADLPLVLLDPRAEPRFELPSIATTDRQGGYDAAAHLIGTGIEHLFVMSGTPRYRFGRAREEGALAAAEELAPGLPTTVLQCGWGGRDARTGLVHALARVTGPVGVFGLNDRIARCAYPAARQLGRSIPGDIRVVGFDDAPFSGAATPSMTTVMQPLAEMGAAAVGVIHALRQRVQLDTLRTELPSRLIARASTSVPDAVDAGRTIEP